MELKKILREQNDKRVKFASNIKGLSSPKLDECKRIEMLECEYLSRYYHFMMFTRSDILSGLATKEKIRTDWLPFWGNGAGTSDFAVGAERVVYALLNGKGIGIPNSAPVGSDLMFELDDAFIHIDMKTVKYDPTVTPDPKKGLGQWNNNIGDFKESIFVGNNQNSYDMIFATRNGRVESYSPNLPHYYNVVSSEKKKKKPCLSYFLSILYNAQNGSLDTICIMLSCMPNGVLGPIYEEAPLRAGKNPGKARFSFPLVPYFETIRDQNKMFPRTKVIYLNEDKLAKDKELKDDLQYIEYIYKSPENLY